MKKLKKVLLGVVAVAFTLATISEFTFYKNEVIYEQDGDVGGEIILHRKKTENKSSVLGITQYKFLVVTVIADNMTIAVTCSNTGFINKMKNIVLGHDIPYGNSVEFYYGNERIDNNVYWDNSFIDGMIVEACK